MMKLALSCNNQISNLDIEDYLSYYFNVGTKSVPYLFRTTKFHNNCHNILWQRHLLAMDMMRSLAQKDITHLCLAY